jgi:hypothetical protein
MFLLSLFAQGNRPSGSPFDRPEIIWGSAGLAAALLAGAVVVYLVDRWRKREALRDRETGTELTGFRAMYERGEITEQEYARLRQKVAERVKSVPAAAGPAPTGATPPDPPTGPATPPTAGPAIPGPFPPGYFDDPEPPSANGTPSPRPAEGGPPA